jgi:PTH1 family peptidyl-tRNA hydrolase
MNKSGISVREIADYFQVKLEDIVVIFDDLDLEVGKLRLREKGGHGGHNGIRDIISHLSTNEFKRIRIGIGKNQLIDSVNYVLGKFSKEESELINQALNKASDAIILYLEENFQAAMNKFNQEIV